MQKLYDQHAGGTLLRSDFATLLYDKMGELKVKLALVEAYRAQDFKNIYQLNKKLYGPLDDSLLSLASHTMETVKPIAKDRM